MPPAVAARRPRGGLVAVAANSTGRKKGELSLEDIKDINEEALYEAEVGIEGHKPKAEVAFEQEEGFAHDDRHDGRQGDVDFSSPLPDSSKRVQIEGRLPEYQKRTTGGFPIGPNHGAWARADVGGIGDLYFIISYSCSNSIDVVRVFRLMHA